MGRPQPAGRLVLARDAAAARSLPDAAARSRVARAGRAVQRTRRGGGGAARQRARRPPSAGDFRRLHPRPYADRAARVAEAGLRMSAYFADVATLVRKDLRLELRARSIVPAMLLFVIAA